MRSSNNITRYRIVVTENNVLSESRPHNGRVSQIIRTDVRAYGNTPNNNHPWRPHRIFNPYDNLTPHTNRFNFPMINGKAPSIPVTPCLYAIHTLNQMHSTRTTRHISGQRVRLSLEEVTAKVRSYHRAPINNDVTNGAEKIDAIDNDDSYILQPIVRQLAILESKYNIKFNEEFKTLREIYIDSMFDVGKCNKDLSLEDKLRELKIELIDEFHRALNELDSAFKSIDQQSIGTELINNTQIRIDLALEKYKSERDFIFSIYS